jgi:hypothetical protein
MPHVSSSSVQVEAWVEVGAQTEITYRVYPASDTIEISVGGSHELELLTSKAGMRNCVEAFTGALKAFEAAPDPD